MPPQLHEHGECWSCIIRKRRCGIPAEAPAFPEPSTLPFLVLLPKTPTKGFPIVPRVKTHWEGKESP